MAQVSPFRGLRYGSHLALQDVVAPPYDVLSAAQAGDLAARSPYNAVHVDLPVPPGVEPSDSAYDAAAASFRRWQAEGALVRDALPSVYLVDQTYRGPDGERRTRRGLIARLHLADLDERVVLPHERTHAGPKIDRLRLYRASHADLSPIFLLYPDDDGRVAKELAAAAGADAPPAWVETHDGDGNLHRLAPLAGAAADRISVALLEQTLYIADGHHRYETALAYRDERRTMGDHSADSLMVYLCGMTDPGLTVFPTHRLVKGIGTPAMDVVLERLTPAFEVEARAEGDAACERLLGRLPQVDDPSRTFGLYFPLEDVSFLVQLKDETKLDKLQARGFSPQAARLSVTILHQLILGDAVGLDPASPETSIDYSTSTADALARLRAGNYSLGAFLNASSVQEVRAIADQGETMPQKSTYFYPKLLSGLVYDALDD
jgi:uncharacterized protein (DUF1015 family)